MSSWFFVVVVVAVVDQVNTGTNPKLLIDPFLSVTLKKTSMFALTMTNKSDDACLIVFYTTSLFVG